jgi:hypothetical protein
MFRKLLCSIFVMAVVVGLCAADDFTVIIKKSDADKNTITFSKFEFGKKGDKGTKAEDVTLPVAKDAKITKGKFNKEDKKIEPGEALPDGLKNEIFTKLNEKKEDKKDEKKDEKKGKGFNFGGVLAQVTTSDDGKTVTAITVMQFGGKKKAEDKKDK